MSEFIRPPEATPATDSPQSVPWQHSLAQEMANASRSIPSSDLEIPKDPRRFTRRQLFEKSAAIGAGMAAVALGVRSTGAESLDGGVEEVDVLGNIEEFVNREPESFRRSFENVPLYQYYADPSYDPRNFSTTRPLDGREESDMLVLGDAADGTRDTHHLGISSPLINYVDFEGNHFILTGEFLGSKAIPFIPPVREDGYQPDTAYVNIGAIGIANGNSDLTRVNRGVVLVNMYFTGRPDWLSLSAEHTPAEGSPIVFEPGDDVDYQMRPLEELLLDLNAHRKDILLSMTAGEVEFNSEVIEFYKQVGYPLQSDFAEQDKLVKRLYNNGLTKFSISSAMENGDSPYIPRGPQDFEPVTQDRIFNDNYKQEDPKKIARRFPKLEILEAESLTAAALVHVPHVGHINIINLS